LLTRELSELAFVQRVLEEAEHPDRPVLERLKFLGITGMLLDEFARIRLAALRERIRAGGNDRSAHGFTPHEHLRGADRASDELLARQDLCWQELRRGLQSSGVSILDAADLTPEEVTLLREYFESWLTPRLEPAVIDADAPLPFIKDGKIVLIADLTSREGRSRKALLPLPDDTPRFIELPGESLRFIALEDVLSAFLADAFADHAIVDRGLARVVREGDLKLADDADDPLLLVSAAVDRREHADVIRLEVDCAMSESLQRYLAEKLGVATNEEIAQFDAANVPIVASEFIIADRLLGLTDTIQLVDGLRGRKVRGLRFARAKRKRPEFVDAFGGDLFKAIAARDRLLHFPFDDFDVVLDFLKQAAKDPDVVSIRQTLYRTGRDSPVVKALARAAKRGKQVTAVVELEAREDERENIALADRLKKAGARVVFGSRDTKVHVKALHVVRREEGGLKGYVNFATGNYHRRAARAYTDLSLFSAAPELTADAVALFDYLIDGVPLRDLRRIAVSPKGLRERLIDLIDREVAHADAGQPAAIWVKLNKLSDAQLIEALYRASQRGVEIQIVVRGVCCLQPGVPGLSERIRVKSVVGRFLEHSRIICFGNGQGLPSLAADVFLSSADWMPHKMDRRVEALVPIDDARAKRHVQEVVMAAYLRDESQSWRLCSDGTWVRDTSAGFSAQSALMNGALVVSE
jgi:polyphosphate kinase